MDINCPEILLHLCSFAPPKLIQIILLNNYSKS